MGVPLIDQVLKNKNLETKKYIEDTIRLVKSIVVVNSKEAETYNKYLQLKYGPNTVLDREKKFTWRYYYHLTSQYHPNFDVPMVVNSIDNGESIVIDRSTMALHRKTREELLKYGNFYEKVVEKYPEQELLLRSIINDPIYTDINEIIGLKDFTIVSYNSALVEKNENNLIQELQLAIENYKQLRLRQNYSLIDTLFSAAQYTTFYNFLVLKILAIRLKNVKTIRAHSYHIKNYFASHLGLDVYYDYLTEKQIMFLYRNLLYLNNHSGREEIYRLLIDKLFTERYISVVNYTYKQLNELNRDDTVKYSLRQRLLNNANLLYSKHNFSLSELLDKERETAPSNIKEITFNEKIIDDKFKYSLSNYLLTKDLETIIQEETDSVPEKLIPIIVNYWAYLLKTNRLNFLVNLLHPVKNSIITMNTKDLFKLFAIALYKDNNVNLTEYPVFYIDKVFVEEPYPTVQQILKFYFKKYYWYRYLINEIEFNIPRYQYIPTSYLFRDFVDRIYRFELGLWITLSNLDEKDTNGQFTLMTKSLIKKYEIYEFDNEPINSFLARIGFSDLFDFDKDAVKSLLTNILNVVYDNNLNFLYRYKKIQDALVGVFEKFKSYTVQIVNEYYRSDTILAGVKDTRLNVDGDSDYRLYYYDFYPINIEVLYNIKDRIEVDFKEDPEHSYSYYSDIEVDFDANHEFRIEDKRETDVYLDYELVNDEDYTERSEYEIDLVKLNYFSVTNRLYSIVDYRIRTGLENLRVKDGSYQQITVFFNNNIVNGLDDDRWIVNQSSEDQLNFLAFNL